MAEFRSGCSSLTTSEPRRAVAFQFTRLHAVAGLVEPEIGELDPFALVPRDEVSDIRLRFAGTNDLAEPFLARIDPDEISSRQLALEDEEAETVEGRDAHAADPENAPPGEAQRGRELSALPRCERDAERCVAFGNGVARHGEAELHTRHRARRHKPDVQGDVVPLQHARTADANVDVELGGAAGDKAHREHEHERRGEHDELGASERDSCKEPEGAE